MTWKNNEPDIVFCEIFGRFRVPFWTHFGDFWALDVKDPKLKVHLAPSATNNEQDGYHNM